MAKAITAALWQLDEDSQVLFKSKHLLHFGMN